MRTHRGPQVKAGGEYNEMAAVEGASMRIYTSAGPQLLPMELSVGLNPPAAPPYPEGYCARERQVSGPPAEQCLKVTTQNAPFF